ncbi:MAG: hypothetical protein AVDCRST_MAG87-3481, partial [uncultured Thermomicrobiales bacterium]
EHAANGRDSAAWLVGESGVRSAVDREDGVRDRVEHHGNGDPADGGLHARRHPGADGGAGLRRAASRPAVRADCRGLGRPGATAADPDWRGPGTGAAAGGDPDRSFSRRALDAAA